MSESEIYVDQEILNYYAPIHEEESLNCPLSSKNGKSLSKSFFTCLGKLRIIAPKRLQILSTMLQIPQSVIHYESAFTQLRGICQETAILTHQSQSLANLKIQELSNISNKLYNVSEQDDTIEHDPAKRPEKFSEGR